MTAQHNRQSSSACHEDQLAHHCSLRGPGVHSCREPARRLSTWQVVCRSVGCTGWLAKNCGTRGCGLGISTRVKGRDSAAWYRRTASDSRKKTARRGGPGLREPPNGGLDGESNFSRGTSQESQAKPTDSSSMTHDNKLASSNKPPELIIFGPIRLFFSAWNPVFRKCARCCDETPSFSDGSPIPRLRGRLISNRNPRTCGKVFF